MMRRSSLTASFSFLGAIVATRLAHADAQAVATFASVGITWSGSGGASDVVCNVRYRPQGTATWRDGYPLWFDSRNAGAGTPGERPANEYRGSIVGLTPGTTYEIELSLAGRSTTTMLTTTTWSENFPIGTTTMVPAMSSDTLRITTSGTATGYALYTVSPGSTATIDVNNAHDNDIFIDAAYVVIRGLTLRGAARNAIDLGPNAHDVVIEENDISGFGLISTSDGSGTNWGGESNAAVYCNNHRTVERIIVQRNRIHHPRSDSNNWEEPRPSRGGDPHPLGPQAVTFETCGGNHVFRYNDIYSDADHYFQDGIGGGDNFSFEGFPRADSDIYGNRISQCWDDGIEAEGADMNVRVWGNYIDQTYVKVAVAAASVGPIYIFRNVGNVSRRSDATDQATVDGEDRGPFIKAGTRDSAYELGRIFVFHNTLLQPADSRYMNTLGCGYGLEDSGGALTAMVSRNNILHIHKSWWQSVGDSNASTTNDFDWDLYNGRIDASPGQESHGWMGVPVYASGNPEGTWYLASTSPGFDVGTRLANFNDDFQGAGPDVGAYESGARALEFGVDAYRNPVTPGDGGLGDSGSGSDASAPPDGSPPDAANSRNDGSTTNRDASADGSTTTTRSGCGCRTPGTATAHSMSIALAALGVVISRRRRRIARH